MSPQLRHTETVTCQPSCISGVGVAGAAVIDS